jgi:glycosyltransferase involved in cell wall biosynthesis
LVEALHFSDRIVCSDIPIFREIATANCVYFSLFGDALGNLSQAITQVLTNQASHAQAASKRFDKSIIAQQYLNLYQL